MNQAKKKKKRADRTEALNKGGGKIKFINSTYS